MATTALVFGTDFDQTAATDWAAGNVRQFHDDRIATKGRWFGRWSDFLIHSLVSISCVDFFARFVQRPSGRPFVLADSELTYPVEVFESIAPPAPWA
ncbi:MAG: hypothetical protein NTV29_07135 [Planctomycetota bacterium]|nr:hypothetical protein [Planctomycetota bacterium]